MLRRHAVGRRSQQTQTIAKLQFALALEPVQAVLANEARPYIVELRHYGVETFSGKDSCLLQSMTFETRALVRVRRQNALMVTPQLALEQL